MKDLQFITYERKDRFPPIYDLTGYPGAIRFASTDPGVKYWKMMALQASMPCTCTWSRSPTHGARKIRARAALADPYIARAPALPAPRLTSGRHRVLLRSSFAAKTQRWAHRSPNRSDPDASLADGGFFG